ncbi:MAG: alpha/beta hydrolase, partial [bacterium]
MNAFYRAKNLDEYHRFVEEESVLDRKRASEGRTKEVVVFVHGLSETRGSWGRFPELLAREDVTDPSLKGKYFKVYVFSYDTVEDSKSVEGFKKELDGFINDVLEKERVNGVHLIGHSFGAVLGLKYMNFAADGVLEGIDRSAPGATAAVLVNAYGEGKFHQAVKSFISIAGSLSGSEIANVAGDRFIPKERLFRKRLPPFRGGVPGYGDIQVRENQIGSVVNLNSFWRLDTERPFDPSDLVRFLPAEAAPPEPVMQRLRGEKIP